MHGERLPTNLTGHVERLFRHAVPGQLQGIGRHPLLERRQHRRRRVEEAVSRHQPVQPLMRALEVVPVDEQTDPGPGVG
jgi:hypothetical protein